MDIPHAIGFAAAACTTISFIPQVVKALRTKHTKDLSLWMLCLLALGVLMWTVYGLMIGEMPVILANSITLLLVSGILAIKLRHG